MDKTVRTVMGLVQQKNDDGTLNNVRQVIVYQSTKYPFLPWDYQRKMGWLEPINHYDPWTVGRD